MHIIIALFLIQGCYYSTGHPVIPNETLSFIPIALQQLANTCENTFLKETIKQKIEYCKINETNHSPSELECFTFYDINSQLCSVFGHSEVNLQENYNTKIKESQNVASLCEHAKTWKFATIQKHPEYSVLEKVFSDSVNCQKLCGVGDIFSDDANYFCSYFKWGTELLQSKEKLMSPQDKNLVLPPSDVLNVADNVAASSTTNNANLSNSPVVKHDETKLLIKPNESTNQVKSEQKIHPTSTNNQKTDVIEKTSENNNIPKNTEQSATPIIVSSAKTDDEDKLVPVEEEPPLKDEIKNNPLPPQQSELDSKGKHEESNPEDDENDNDDYGAPDDLQPEVVKKQEHGVVESDPDVIIKEYNKAKVGIESITYNNGNTPQRVAELFPNSMQETYTNDDDHFFPIFITGIIIVVLLYILYHNKNKFTKVILGLLVEGRQSGRRRNSRGHAYRRLDTLEQAMSSNTAAPPSKIIY